MNTYHHRITHKLNDGFAPLHLDVLDESHQHQGHGGWREGGETHFRVRLVSARFAGLSRIDRHRLVNAALKDELNERVHALALELKAPNEA
ncbi:MAG: BolA family protein [Bosea sp. (in: a-proteobacteria)]